MKLADRLAHLSYGLGNINEYEELSGLHVYDEGIS